MLCISSYDIKHTHTNAGKTYTVTGPHSDPGILPRSLDVIFNSIEAKQLMNVATKPKYYSEVTYLSEEDKEEEQKIKEKILNMVIMDIWPNNTLCKF